MVGVIDRLRSAIGELQELDVDAVDPHELARLVRELMASSSRLDAVRAAVVGAWDARQVWALDGARTGPAWLRHRCRLSAPRAAREVALARRLRTMPVAAEALAAGQITIDHVQRLVAPRNARTDACFVRDEAVLVDAACSLTFAKFHTAMQRWDHLADPDGAEDRAAARHGARRVHLSKTIDGTWMLDGQLDEVAGDALDAALAAATDRLFATDWAHARAAAPDAPAPQLARSPAQRRADALVELVARGHQAGPARHRPLVDVVVDAHSFGRVCELASGTVLTAGQVAALLHDAHVRAIWLDTNGQIATASRQRRFSGVLRQLVELRDRECRHPLCDEPAHRCEIDHIIPYPHGPTSIDNAQLLCRHHHRIKTGTDPPAAP